MRQIVLDTETTGINPLAGHRLIEVGCIELIDRKLTGNHYHTYINPERDVEEGAFRVHGISTEFLQDKPLFKEIVHDLITFIDGAELIIHNAPFDTGFLNAELTRLNWPKQLEHHCTVFDTLVFARQKHPGQRNNLDALCKRYDINNVNRQLHGALLDAQILASVYLAMTGGQGNLFTEEVEPLVHQLSESTPVHDVLRTTTPIISPSAEELAQHHEFIKFLVKKSGINRWPDTLLPLS